MSQIKVHQFESKANKIISQIKEDLSKDVQERSTQISSSDLKVMLSHIKNLKERVLKDNLPPKEQRHARLTRIIIDTWPLGTVLGNEISELEEIYQNL